MIEGGPVSRTTNLGPVQAFIKKCNQAITSKGFRATVGSASYKWSCNCGSGCKSNWWKDTGLSFYTVHYYAWMVDGSNKYDPFNTKPSDWCIYDKPVLIGESPAWTDRSLKGTISVANQYYLAKNNGYMGVMPWSDKANTDQAKWSEIQRGLQCQRNWSSCKPSFVKQSLNTSKNHHHE